MNVARLAGTSWLVHDGHRGIVVDAGRKRRIGVFERRLRPLGLELPLLLLTHTHFDHAGSAQALCGYTGAAVMVGAAEADSLRQGYTPIPRPLCLWSRTVAAVGRNLLPRQTEHYEAVTARIVAVDAARDLAEYGFDAKVIPLGAHTQGSIGLLIDGYFFAGDTVYGIGGALFPPFADCPEGIGTAWETILRTGAMYICPGHGPVIPREKLRKKYEKLFANTAARAR